jgi:hypothetical protein
VQRDQRNPVGVLYEACQRERVLGPQRGARVSALPLGTRVQLSTGQPRPKRGKWVQASWDVRNGQGTVDEVTPDYIAVRMETRADGSPIVVRQTQVIHHGATHVTVTPL